MQLQFQFHQCQKFHQFLSTVASFGEAGILGFLEHLDSRSAAQLTLETVAVDGRQKMGSRQLLGLPTFFMAGLSQSTQWTLMALRSLVISGSSSPASMRNSGKSCWPEWELHDNNFCRPGQIYTLDLSIESYVYTA